MTAVILNILVIAFCGYALYLGWLRGSAGSMAALISWCFAVIAMRLGYDGMAQYLLDEGMGPHFEESDLAASYFSATAIYCIVSLLVGIALTPLFSVVSIFGHGAVGSLAGAVMTLLRWLTLASLILNLWGACSPGCTAVRVADGGDGGVIEEVMYLAPVLTGLPDFSEFVHRRQLKEARFISLNPSPPSDVLYKELQLFNPKYVPPANSTGTL